MNNDSIQKAYRWFAPVYDILLNPFLDNGREIILKKISAKRGAKILEVGIGTGSAICRYHPTHSVIGIDISSHMLKKAQTKAQDKKEISLIKMDGQSMGFKDGVFDTVILMYVLSVAPDPKGVIRDISRVCKPHGDIYIVNHFSTGKNPFAWCLSKLLSPLFKLLRFDFIFPLETCLKGSRLQIIDIKSANVLGLWKVIHLKNSTLQHNSR